MQHEYDIGSFRRRREPETLGYMDAEPGIRALMLVRLRTQQPDGTVVGETRSACHLVPVPGTNVMPEFLFAYCGLRIAPGAAEVLPSAVGMPCELCMARLALSTSGGKV